MLDSQLVRIDHDPKNKNQLAQHFTQDDVKGKHDVIVIYISIWFCFPSFLENNQNDSADPTELSTARKDRDFDKHGFTHARLIKCVLQTAKHSSCYNWIYY